MGDRQSYKLAWIQGCCLCIVVHYQPSPQPDFSAYISSVGERTPDLERLYLVVFSGM